MIDPNLAALYAKADAFFTRVEHRHAAELACRPGCASCCQGGLTVTAVEAAAVRKSLELLDPATLTRLRTRPADPTRCALLDDDDRCTVYAARPLVCRTHGLPIKLDAGHRLPVIRSCRLNFTARGPEHADADCILDQKTLSTVLAAVDLNFTKTQGIPGDRVSLAALLGNAG